MDANELNYRRQELEELFEELKTSEEPAEILQAV
jgi:hypothetical protein